MYFSCFKVTKYVSALCIQLFLCVSICGKPLKTLLFWFKHVPCILKINIFFIFPFFCFYENYSKKYIVLFICLFLSMRHLNLFEIQFMLLARSSTKMRKAFMHLDAFEQFTFAFVSSSESTRICMFELIEKLNVNSLSAL